MPNNNALHRRDNKPLRTLMIAFSAGISFILLIGLACNLPGQEDSLSKTQVALSVKSTSLAQQESEIQAKTLAAGDATKVAQDVQATVAAQQSTQQAQTTSTATPQPTPTSPPPTQTIPPTTTESPAPTEEQATPETDIREMIQNSNILLFEDMTKLFEPRYVKEALDSMGLSANYTDVKDAVGDFKTQLLSGTDWDLIIVAVEARTGVQGEFFVYLNEQLNKGTSVILEHWNLDDLAGGRASTILASCGVRLQADWYDPPDTARSVWLLRGEHPIFHQPNEGISLTNYTLYWFGDAGDLLRTAPGSDAVLLAGTYAQEKSNYGTLATCLDGRLILQTFSTHDYHRDDMVRLWQNYVHNALIAHFEYEASQGE